MSVDRWWNPLARWRKAKVRSTAARVHATAAPAAVAAAAATTSPGRAAGAASAVGPRDAAVAEDTTLPGILTATAADEVAVEEPVAVRNLRFVCWLLGARPNAAARPPASALIAEMLVRVDEIIASDTLRTALLPRAPHVVPQLMKTLRDDAYSSADVADRISRDPVLTAEVVRSAGSMLARSGDGDGSDGEDGEPIDLARAVQVVGTAGLRRAIAKVVLRPIFDARGTSLSARAANQIWKDADRKARLGAAFAGDAGLDPFDGYLAGLLHNSGWTAVLRAIDNLDDLSIGVAEAAHPEVVPHIVRRRDTLFGVFVGGWNLGARLDALAEEVARVGLERATGALAVALREADRLAALRALAPAGKRGAAAVPRWSELGAPVREAYASLG